MHCPGPRHNPAPLLGTIVAVWLGITRVVFASPSCLNLIPTADVLADGELSLQLEADGHTWPCDEGAEYWLLTCLGVADRLEIGLDRVMPQGVEGDWFMDAKVRLVDETKSVPAVALGALDLTRDGIDSNWYLVGTKSFGRVG